MKDLLRTTAERAARYLAGLKNRGVAPSPEALTNLRRLDEALPELPTDPAAVVALLDEIGSPATMASAGGRFFGFVVGGSLPATVAANNLAAAWDQNSGIVRAGCAPKHCHPWTTTPSSASRRAMSTPGHSIRPTQSSHRPRRRAPGCTWTGRSGCGRPRLPPARTS